MKLLSVIRDVVSVWFHRCQATQHHPVNAAMSDVVVKLRQLGRIMTGAVALCCECEPSVFEELNNLRVSHCETAEAKVGRCTLC